MGSALLPLARSYQRTTAPPARKTAASAPSIPKIRFTIATPFANLARPTRET